ncbi:hypothetical protein K2173_006423 [Erythroxylum novogranatense]|uniref:Uncharacterized protein n=1 Tax=Erythroxylum novogranatense TaxID=1862640 RepID=A0AAV8U3I9_9ROSI|nr:hypothetical protein K2173_006423 [Erythroxylum novogranatense]
MFNEVTGHDKAKLETWYVDDSKKRSLKPNSFSDVHSSADFSKEHKAVIKQLKLELRSATEGGLPTILEEPETEELETPKVVSKLKPLKIAEHIEHLMEEIQKVYKSYSDRIRKLDAIKIQTMHAYGLFELKDAIQSYTVRKSSIATIKSAILQNLRPYKQRTAAVDPTKKVIADMDRDFEMVYVGHVCLSWEILHWQYCKLRELQIYDSQGPYHYNQVAGEFQFFQALVESFVENEPFQGPRVQNYVKNRCVLQSLLQVPLIKDDDVMGLGKRGDEGDTISIETLVDIIEGSLLAFWEFLRVDKVRSNVALEDRHHFQDLINPELLVEIQINLQKKEKTIRDILRIRNCIVKKFQKSQHDQLHQSLLLAQVNLKLVSRVQTNNRSTIMVS